MLATCRPRLTNREPKNGETVIAVLLALRSITLLQRHFKLLRAGIPTTTTFVFAEAIYITSLLSAG